MMNGLISLSEQELDAMQSVLGIREREFWIALS